MSNPLVFGTLIELTFVTNLSYTVFLKTPIYTTLLCLLKSAGTVFSLSISILSTLAFKVGKSDYAARLDILNQLLWYN